MIPRLFAAYAWIHGTSKAWPIPFGSNCLEPCARPARPRRSMLAAKLGESSGATSYHLRQLADFGFIEEDKERGSGRERWWRAAHDSSYFDEASLSGDPDMALLGVEYLRAVAKGTSARIVQWIEAQPKAPEAWAHSGTMSDWALRLTPDQARDLGNELQAVIERYPRFDPEGTEVEGTAFVAAQIQILPHFPEEKKSMKPSDRKGVGLLGLLAANGISLTGTSMSLLALPWFVISMTGRATTIGLVTLAEMLPYVLVLGLGGPLVDRIGPWRTSVVTDLVAAAAMGLVPLAHAAHALSLPVLVFSVAIAGRLPRRRRYGATRSPAPRVGEGGNSPRPRQRPL